MSAPSPKALSTTTLRLIRFQRYLTRYYPLTSAMSYQIGKYVDENFTHKKVHRAKVVASIK